MVFEHRWAKQQKASLLGLSLNLEDGTHCDEAREQAQLKLMDVRAKLADLERIEAALADLVEQCCAVRGNIRCPLIGALRGID